MQSKDGSKVSVLSGINHDIEDYWLTKHDRGPFDAFYPGQEVVSIFASKSNAIKNASKGYIKNKKIFFDILDFFFNQS